MMVLLVVFLASLFVPSSLPVFPAVMAASLRRLRGSFDSFLFSYFWTLYHRCGHITRHHPLHPFCPDLLLDGIVLALGMRSTVFHARRTQLRPSKITCNALITTMTRMRSSVLRTDFGDVLVAGRADPAAGGNVVDGEVAQLDADAAAAVGRAGAALDRGGGGAEALGLALVHAVVPRLARPLAQQVVQAPLAAALRGRRQQQRQQEPHGRRRRFHVLGPILHATQNRNRQTEAAPSLSDKRPA